MLPAAAATSVMGAAGAAVDERDDRPLLGATTAGGKEGRTEKRARVRRGRATRTDRQAWQWRREHAAQPGKGRGMSGNSSTNLAYLHSFLFRCECGAFVQYSAALLQAKAAGRQRLRPGDGCASRTCSSSFHAGRFADTQERWAAEVHSGERPLITRPSRRARRWLYLAEPSTSPPFP